MAARAGWRSSIWATSSSRSRRAGSSRRTLTATSASWSTTRTPCVGRSSAPGSRPLGGRGLDFRDPWGNLIQVVQYDEIQFLKTDAVLRAMGLELGKTEQALAELRAKGVEVERA